MRIHFVWNMAYKEAWRIASSNYESCVLIRAWNDLNYWLLVTGRNSSGVNRSKVNLCQRQFELGAEKVSNKHCAGGNVSVTFTLSRVITIHIEQYLSTYLMVSKCICTLWHFTIFTLILIYGLSRLCTPKISNLTLQSLRVTILLQTLQSQNLLLHL